MSRARGAARCRRGSSGAARKAGACRPALLRAGRIDYRLDFGPAQPDQARELFLRFFPDDTDADLFAAMLDGRGHTVADLQGLLLTARTGSAAVEALLDRQP